MAEIKNIIMVGLPGSGKSTRIAKHYGPHIWFVYSTDNEIENIAHTLNLTYDEAFKDHFKLAETTAKNKLAVWRKHNNNLNVIFDQTNLGVSKRSKIVDPSQLDITIVNCFLPPKNKEQHKILRDRLNNRPGKTIPGWLVINMLRSYVLPTTDEGFKDVLYFDFVDGREYTREEAEVIFAEAKEYLDLTYPPKVKE